MNWTVKKITILKNVIVLMNLVPVRGCVVSAWNTIENVMNFLDVIFLRRPKGRMKGLFEPISHREGL